MSSGGPPTDPAIVGRVARPHGLSGEVVVKPSNEGSSTFEPGSRLWLNDGWTSVLRCRPDRGRFVVLLEGIEDRDAAESVRGAELMIDGVELPQLEADRYYVHDLVGCRVEDAGGEFLGEVVAVVPGPRDWLEVEKDGTIGLVPMAREILEGVDLDAKRIVVNPPEGLLDATAAPAKERSDRRRGGGPVR